VVSSRGGKYGFVYPGQQDVYRALRRKRHMSKTQAARIANSKHKGGKRKAKKGKARARRRR
jgi:hypothetical protein